MPVKVPADIFGDQRDQALEVGVGQRDIVDVDCLVRALAAKAGVR